MIGIPYSLPWKNKIICSKTRDWILLEKTSRETRKSEWQQKIYRSTILKSHKEPQNKNSVAFCQTLAKLLKTTGMYLILAQHFKGYSKKNWIVLLKEIGA